jgi:hypothetical protein
LIASGLGCGLGSDDSTKSSGDIQKAAFLDLGAPARVTRLSLWVENGIAVSTDREESSILLIRLWLRLLHDIPLLRQHDIYLPTGLRDRRRHGGHYCQQYM